MNWWVWPVGGAVLVVAGFLSALLPRARARRRRRLLAWSTARAAIAAASVSRDACVADVPEAAELLARAELTAGARGGVAAAAAATEQARRADRLWREARP
ncbi:hypothetical protein FHR81_004459 [Actinoalloteichus hoggarensis]|uniref:DUF6403 family protein n=1 Tax=Actinoalloteichus hoggarensis TaxID=1470176 RepID=UPI000B8ADA6F|nr:DUF6403 family protein [Actinoalloteichus hoggarensis]MBB5923388.1 hypothetical protein [Actinoalloteichus hoggarensis]